MQTPRLELRELSITDAAFIVELVNTPEWLKFIGERNVKSIPDALVYIQQIIANPNAQYWVVCLKTTTLQIGIITLIKRDYLDFHDIGFAFLSQYRKQGYAFEATQRVLESLALSPIHRQILAITVPDNHHSVLLLERLRMKRNRTMVIGEEELSIYGLTIK